MSNETNIPSNRKMFIQLSKESIDQLKKKNIKLVNNGLLPLNSSMKLKEEKDDKKS